MVRKSTSIPRSLIRVSMLLIIVAVGAGLACGGDSSGLGTTPGGPQVDLSIASAQNPDTIPEGGTVSFTVTVKNLGTVDATGVIAGDTLASGLTYVSSSGSNNTVYSSTTRQWLIGALPAGAARTLTITATAKTGSGGSWQTNNAGVLAQESDSVLSNNIAIDSVRVATGTQPPPPPVGNGEPVDPGSGYLWSDNFDRYASVLAMESPGGCPAGSDGYGLPDGYAVYGRRTAYAAGSAQQACTLQKNLEGKPTYELITGRSGTGKALRGNVATSPSTSQGGIDWLSPWGGSGSSFQQDPTKSIVIQFWVRISPGGHVGPVGGKWLLLWVDNLGGPARDRIQFAWTGFNPVVWRPQDGPNTSGFYRTAQPVGPYANPNVNDGQWHRITHLFKPNSSTTYQHVGGTSPANEIYNGTSSRDGRIAMWVDGVKVMDVSQATVGVTPPGGTNPWCYQSDVDWIPHAAGQYLEFPSVINDSAMSWTIDHDDLKVWQF